LRISDIEFNKRLVWWLGPWIVDAIVAYATVREEAMAKSMIVMEAGFKIRSGQEEAFLTARDKMMPMAMAQPGFVSVYGGQIAKSDWLYFGVRFDAPETMDAWYNVPQHQAIQGASRKWWTAVYIRKWLAPPPADDLDCPVLAETRICPDTPLVATAIEEICNSLQSLSGHAAPFETLTGQFEPQPFQLVGPLEIAPSPAPVLYSLFTHWQKCKDLRAWQKSSSYGDLTKLGEVTTEVFMPFAEPNPRPDLREDRMQRDWTLDGSHLNAKRVSN
jgi:heme-degrading monooxygenase HmoA